MNSPIERSALYYLLRLNWMNDHSLAVEPWQVEDYRLLSIETLFNRLEKFEIHLDRNRFIGFADECDSPEDFTDHLTASQNLSPGEEDQIYLLVFELWRKLMADKPSISIVCNELDHQIYLYEQEQWENPLALQDALIHFSQVLQENVDQGIPAGEVMELISNYCGTDIEAFLYDYISDQIEEDGETYAHELLDVFEPYLMDNKWFKLLRMRLFGSAFSRTSQNLLEEIIEDHLQENDLEFNLELLSILADLGADTNFRLILKKTYPLVDNVENFQDILEITYDYFRSKGQQEQQSKIESLLKIYRKFPLNKSLDKQSDDLKIFLQLFDL